MLKLIISFLFLSSVHAQDLQCPPGTLLIDFTPSLTRERVQMCQKKVDGKFLKHGPEVVYNKDGSIKSKNYYLLDKQTQAPEKKSLENVNPTDGVFASADSTCWIKKGGVKCWGQNTGDGNNTGSSSPQQVTGLESGVTTLSVASHRTCAVYKGVEIKCWSDTYLENAETFKTYEPTKYKPGQLATLDGSIKSITQGKNKTLCAVTSANRVKCFYSSGDVMEIPEEIQSGVEAISMDGSSTANHFCALKGPLVKCWGSWLWQIDPVKNPTNIPNLEGSIHAIVTGRIQDCFIAGGSVSCMGHKDLSLESSNLLMNKNPVRVSGFTGNVTAIALGDAHACGLMDNGGVKCWGKNHYGQLGDGTAVNKTAAVDVIDLNAKAVSIAAGSNHTCALLENGETKCWGRNSFGQLGYGKSGGYMSTPVSVVEKLPL